MPLVDWCRIKGLGLSIKPILFRRSVSSSASARIIHIPKANVYRFGDSNASKPLFRDLEWTVNEGESWAVVGSGSGAKTALFQASLIEVHFYIHSNMILRCFWGTCEYLHLHLPQKVFSLFCLIQIWTPLNVFQSFPLETEDALLEGLSTITQRVMALYVKRTVSPCGRVCSLKQTKWTKFKKNDSTS